MNECRKCGVPIRVIDSTCWQCSGRKPPIEVVTAKARPGLRQRWVVGEDGTFAEDCIAPRGDSSTTPNTTDSAADPGGAYSTPVTSF